VSETRIKLRDAVGKMFSLATGDRHKFVLIRPKVFVLDVEDSHFNFDRRVTSGGGTPGGHDSQLELAAR